MVALETPKKRHSPATHATHACLEFRETFHLSLYLYTHSVVITVDYSTITKVATRGRLEKARAMLARAPAQYDRGGVHDVGNLHGEVSRKSEQRREVMPTIVYESPVINTVIFDILAGACVEPTNSFPRP